MKILVAGGTGFIGRAILTSLCAQHEVACLTRRDAGGSLPSTVRSIPWDGNTLSPDHVNGVDAIVNFAGESIGARRWTNGRKGVILGSRMNSVRSITNAIIHAKTRPPLLVNASAVGYYGSVKEGDVTETSPKGKGFLADVCAAWEREALAVSSFGVRVVILRLGVVLGKGGGALSRMAFPFRLYAGGSIGSGRQWFPWIHRDDVAGALSFVLQRNGLSGPVNLVAPETIRMKEFCSALGFAMNRPCWAPVPSVLLKVILGEMADMILTGQKVVPIVLREAKYTFKYPSLYGALGDVFKS